MKTINKVTTTYQCEYCKSSYAVKDSAQQCECDCLARKKIQERRKTCKHRYTEDSYTTFRSGERFSSFGCMYSGVSKVCRICGYEEKRTLANLKRKTLKKIFELMTKD